MGSFLVGVGRVLVKKNRCEAGKNAMAIVFLADTPRAPPEFFSPVRAARRLRHDDHVPQARRLGQCAQHLHREAQLRQAQNTPSQEKKREFFESLRNQNVIVAIMTIAIDNERLEDNNNLPIKNERRNELCSDSRSFCQGFPFVEGDAISSPSQRRLDSQRAN